MGPGGRGPYLESHRGGSPPPSAAAPSWAVISQSLNRQAYEMGMTIAVTPPCSPRPPPQESGAAPMGALTPTSATDICVPWETAPTGCRLPRQPVGGGTRPPAAHAWAAQAAASRLRRAPSPSAAHRGSSSPAPGCPGPGRTAGASLGLHFSAVKWEARPHFPPRGALGVSPRGHRWHSEPAVPPRPWGATRVPPLAPPGQASGSDHGWVRSRRALEPTPYLEVLGDETFWGRWSSGGVPLTAQAWRAAA